MAKAKKIRISVSKNYTMSDMLNSEITVYGSDEEAFASRGYGQILRRKVRIGVSKNGKSRYVCLNDLAANLGLKNVVAEANRARTQMGSAKSFIRVKTRTENQKQGLRTATYIPLPAVALYLASLDRYAGSDDLNRALLKRYQKDAVKALGNHFEKARQASAEATATKTKSRSPKASKPSSGENLATLLNELKVLAEKIRKAA